MENTLIRLSIKNHFGTARLLSDADLISPECGLSDGAAQAANLFQGKTWNNIDLMSLFHTEDALGSLSDVAFGYYIPAYLDLIVAHYCEADALVDTVINTLTPPVSNGEPRVSWIEKKLKFFNKQQRQVIATVLQHLKIQHGDFGAKHALEIYWHRYLEEQ
ncbi:hypothetical protein JCM19000A_05530 [Silvimonas sp. JCM 19000]